MHKRYFIRLSFRGTNYKGWQRQPAAITVQEVLEKALSAILRESINVTGGARTDTGVHAINYVAHFDSLSLEPGYVNELKYKLNGFLPYDISIHDIINVGNDTHARFDAVSRTYHYVVSREKNPFLREFSHFVPWQPDITKMNKACEIIKEQTDFTSFSKLHSNNKTNLCSISDAIWYETSNRILVFRITSNRFLRGMVRAITGTMLDIGKGKMQYNSINDIFAQKNRSMAGISVPAKGLFFSGIQYREEIFEGNSVSIFDFLP